MLRKVFHYLQIAGQTAKKKGPEDKRTFLLGAVGVRSDGKMVKSFNSSTVFPVPAAHAEFRVAAKLDVDSVVYVARVRVGDGKFALAKPCKNCQRVLKSRGVRRVYYTTNYPNEYGILYLS